MHLTLAAPPSPACIKLGRGAAGRLRRVEDRLRQAQRPGHPRGDGLRQRIRAVQPPDGLPQQDQAQVAVVDRPPRLIDERVAGDQVERLLQPRPVRNRIGPAGRRRRRPGVQEEIAPGSQASGVGQQVEECDRAGVNAAIGRLLRRQALQRVRVLPALDRARAVAGQLRDHVGDPPVQFDAALGQQHQEGRGGEQLGHRSQVKERVRRHRLPGGLRVQVAAGALVDGPATVIDGQDDGWRGGGQSCAQGVIQCAEGGTGSHGLL